MIKSLSLYTSLTLLSLPLHAATTFSAAIDNDFNNAANWDNGLPDTVGAADIDDEGIIQTGTTANMSASYQTSTGRRIWITVNGTLNTGANELQLRSGSTGTNARGSNGDLIVDSGTLNVNSGGRVDLAGVGADLFIDGGGTANFEDGSTIQVSKALEILDGTLSFGSNVTSATSISDEFVVDDNGVLSFTFDSLGNHFTAAGNTLLVELGATSTLALDFTAGAPTTGDTFTLINGVSSFAGVNGGTGDGTFGTVTALGLNDGQSIQVDYGSNVAGELQITVIPEPSSTTLIGLAGLGLILRRRR